MSVELRGQVTFRRALSKRLVFYDFAYQDALCGQQKWVELLVKAGKTLSQDAVRDIRDTVKLGDVVHVVGTYEQASHGHTFVVQELVVLRPWREQQPDRPFLPQPGPQQDPQGPSRSRGGGTKGAPGATATDGRSSGRGAVAADDSGAVAADDSGAVAADDSGAGAESALRCTAGVGVGVGVAAVAAVAASVPGSGLVEGSIASGVGSGVRAPMAAGGVAPRDDGAANPGAATAAATAAAAALAGAATSGCGSTAPDSIPAAASYMAGRGGGDNGDAPMGDTAEAPGSSGGSSGGSSVAAGSASVGDDHDQVAAGASDVADHLVVASTAGGAIASSGGTSGGGGGGGGAVGSQGVCKYWAATGRCPKGGGGGACKYDHPPERCGASGAQHQYATRRRSERLAAAADQGFVHEAGAAAKRRRAAVLCDWLVQAYGRDYLNSGTGVLDVAGGRGALTFHLLVRCGVTCTLIEPRPAKLSRRQYLDLAARGVRLPSPPLSYGGDGDGGGGAGGLALPQLQRCFGPELWRGIPGARVGVRTGSGGGSDSGGRGCMDDGDGVGIAEGGCGDDGGESGAGDVDGAWELLAGCSMVVGLHPDQATDAILQFALRFRKPFAIVPCCVFPRLFPHRRLRIAVEYDTVANRYPNLNLDLNLNLNPDVDPNTDCGRQGGAAATASQAATHAHALPSPSALWSPSLSSRTSGQPECRSTRLAPESPAEMPLTSPHAPQPAAAVAPPPPPPTSTAAPSPPPLPLTPPPPPPPKQGGTGPLWVAVESYPQLLRYLVQQAEADGQVEAGAEAEAEAEASALQCDAEELVEPSSSRLGPAGAAGGAHNSSDAAQISCIAGSVVARTQTRNFEWRLRQQQWLALCQLAVSDSAATAVVPAPEPANGHGARLGQLLRCRRTGEGAGGKGTAAAGVKAGTALAETLRLLDGQAAAWVQGDMGKLGDAVGGGMGDAASFDNTSDGDDDDHDDDDADYGGGGGITEAGGGIAVEASATATAIATATAVAAAAAPQSTPAPTPGPVPAPSGRWELGGVVGLNADGDAGRGPPGAMRHVGGAAREYGGWEGGRRQLAAGAAGWRVGVARLAFEGANQVVYRLPVCR